MCGAFDKCDQDSVMILIFTKRKRPFKIERPQNAVCVLLYDRTQIR